MNEELDYKQMYDELKKELRIHESHTHSRTLEYVRHRNDRDAAAQEILAHARSFIRVAGECERMTM